MGVFTSKLKKEQKAFALEYGKNNRQFLFPKDRNGERTNQTKSTTNDYP